MGSNLNESCTWQNDSLHEEIQADRLFVRLREVVLSKPCRDRSLPNSAVAQKNYLRDRMHVRQRRQEKKKNDVSTLVLNGRCCPVSCAASARCTREQKKAKPRTVLRPRCLLTLGPPESTAVKACRQLFSMLSVIRRHVVFGKLFLWFYVIWYGRWVELRLVLYCIVEL